MPTFKELMKKADEFKRAAEKQRKREIAGIVKEIRKKMDQYGVTLGDLRFGKRRRRRRKRTAKGRVPIKFRNPATGDTWSGRGRTPRWLSALEKRGQSREQFRVKPK